MPSNVYRFVERWTIPNASPEEVYAVISEARLLPEWWKGVYLSVEPLDGEWTSPRVGFRVRAVARGFLPYKLHFVLESTVLEPARAVEVRIRGDLDGTWRAALSADGPGTRVDIEEQVIAEKPLVRALSPLLKPLFAWNHYWTTPRGERGLRAYLAGKGAT
ncbi:MAG TPA: SRPBCC family protein [bacterium]|nr:SRPBCC family protein [bacterium]